MNNIAPGKRQEELEKWFLWFWVKKAKVSYLLTLLLLFVWIFSLSSIPKESTPEISFWIVWVITAYPWVNPTDVDSLITEKIEKEIRYIDWVKDLDSTSSIWVSQIIVELSDWVDAKDVINDIRSKIETISLPTEAQEPRIFEAEMSVDLMFEAVVYWDASKYSEFDLIQKAQLIKATLEWTIPWLSWIDVWWFNQYSTTSYDYDILVLLDKAKIEQLWISIPQISQIVRSYNKNTPIWNHSIWELNYDYRFEWEFSDIEELKNLVIRSNWESNILLKDIAEFERKYEDDIIRKVWFKEEVWMNYISLAFRKNKWENVFSVSAPAKEAITHLVETNPAFKDLKISYTNDLSEIISQDYTSLWKTWMQTIIAVFAILLIFIWFKESILSALMIPLSFLITFIFLYFWWYTMNFLTNFWLVLSLWITIDVIIVLIEAWSSKIKLWFNNRSAILLALREFIWPLISGTLTTLAAFLPLMFLPWPMWKVLAYLPITVFATFVAALVLWMTLGSALFILLIKSKNTYTSDKEAEETLDEDWKNLLFFERQWKTEIKWEGFSLRERFLNFLSLWYANILKKVVWTKLWRNTAIFLPIILLVLSIVFISPKLWFTLMPEWDNGQIQIDIKTKEWSNKEVLAKYIPLIDETLKGQPELKIYTTSISGNSMSVYIELIDKNIRKDERMRNVFDFESMVTDSLKIIESEGNTLSIATTWGMSTWKALWIKLIAWSSSKMDELKSIANDIKDYLSKLEWVKNATTSWVDSPGQFIFKFNREKLAQLWLTPDSILSEVYYYISWLNSWTIKSTYEDNEIILKIAQFEDNLSPDDVANLIINTSAWQIRVWDFSTYEFAKSISAISRENTRVTISVEADIDVGYLPSNIQPLLEKFASEYDYPEGITYESWWENAENADLINAVILSFILAVFLIFLILVTQFNSYSKPWIIVFSIPLGLIWVNIWLLLTWNPYSITFMIWFIALTWIIINNALLLVDRIWYNIDLGIEPLKAVTNAAKSRIQPILVTTLTTCIWLLPLAMQDEFWAWLGYTVVFGLAFGTIMTLFVTPSLYYSIYVVRKEKKEQRRLKKLEKKKLKELKKLEKKNKKEDKKTTNEFELDVKVWKEIQ